MTESHPTPQAGNGGFGAALDRITSTRDLYEQLNVSRDATVEQIQVAYHAARSDVNPRNVPEENITSATVMTLLLIYAHMVLSNETYRANYDVSTSTPSIGAESSDKGAVETPSANHQRHTGSSAAAYHPFFVIQEREREIVSRLKSSFSDLGNKTICEGVLNSYRYLRNLEDRSRQDLLSLIFGGSLKYALAAKCRPWPTYRSGVIARTYEVLRKLKSDLDYLLRCAHLFGEALTGLKEKNGIPHMASSGGHELVALLRMEISRIGGWAKWESANLFLWYEEQCAFLIEHHVWKARRSLRITEVVDNQADETPQRLGDVLTNPVHSNLPTWKALRLIRHLQRTPIHLPLKMPPVQMTLSKLEIEEAYEENIKARRSGGIFPLSQGAALRIYGLPFVLQQEGPQSRHNSSNLVIAKRNPTWIDTVMSQRLTASSHSYVPSSRAHIRLLAGMAVAV